MLNFRIYTLIRVTWVVRVTPHVTRVVRTQCVAAVLYTLLGTWGAVAQVLGTFDSRVATRTPVWDVKILVDPVDNATLQVVRAELLSKGAGHRLYMQYLLNRCVLLRNWLPPSLPTILFCKCNCPNFEGQRAFGNAARKLA